MKTTMFSFGLTGISGVPVTVSIEHCAGMPGMDVTGIPGVTVRETRHRVRSAIRAGGYGYPSERMVVVCDPSDLLRPSTGHDLAFAVGVLCLTGVCPAPAERTMFLGELGLDGSVRPVPGALIAGLTCFEFDIGTLYCAPECAAEAAAASGVKVIPVRSLVELVEHLHGHVAIEPATHTYTPSRYDSAYDLKSIRGQGQAKRALEIAAAGGHNLVFVGPPGCGKTLLARALPSILPPMTLEEAIDTSRVHSVSGLTRSNGLLRARPFRSPHPTASEAAIVGGGQPSHPGEVSLAHNGVLFLDEAPEFRRAVLDALLAPVEDGRVVIARGRRTAYYPARAQVVAAMNPCACGYYGSTARVCVCTPAQVSAYQSRFTSSPLIRVFDVGVELPAVSPERLLDVSADNDTATVQARVVAARERQAARNRDGCLNAALKLPDLDRSVPLATADALFLARACDALGVTARRWDRLRCVARTIADLACSDTVQRPHLMEALALTRTGLGNQ